MLIALFLAAVLIGFVALAYLDVAGPVWAGAIVVALAVIAACTEVPLVLSSDTLAVPVISSTDALVTRAIEFANRN